MATITYIIHPTRQLEEVLINYPNHTWGNIHLWEMEKHHGPSRGLPFDHVILAKALYLVQIACVERPDSDTQNLITTLFGNPPKYNVTLFDKWWTIEEQRGGAFFATTLKQARPQDYAAISMTGYDPIDEWLRYKSKPTQDIETKYNQDDIRHYVRFPTPALLDITKEKPNNMWTGKALWNLPSGIITQQAQYDIVLLKVIYLIHLAQHGQPYGTKSSWMKQMFGEHPYYSIENFDKWWMIKPTNIVGGFQQILDNLPHDPALRRAFKHVELTGHQGTDEWLGKMSSIRIIDDMD